MSHGISSNERSWRDIMGILAVRLRIFEFVIDALIEHMGADASGKLVPWYNGFLLDPSKANLTKAIFQNAPMHLFQV